MVYEARRCGMKRVFLSEENVQEGRAVDGIEIVGVRDVKALTACLQHPEQIHGQWFTPDLFQAGQEEFDVDFDEIVGLPLVRQATEAAAAGVTTFSISTGWNGKNDGSSAYSDNFAAAYAGGKH